IRLPVALSPTRTLEPVVLYGVSGERGHRSGRKQWEKQQGFQGSVLYSESLAKGLNNLAVFQYGEGLYGAHGAWGSSNLNQYGGFGSQNIAKGDSATKSAREDSSTIRVVDQLVAQFGDSWSGALVVLYQDVNFGGETLVGEDDREVEIPNKTELTFGLRPQYHFSKHYSLAVEYGYSQVANGVRTKDDNGELTFADSEVHKFTIAPQVGYDFGYWARPQLRVFFTYAKWNDDSKGLVGEEVYQSNTSGFSTGAQLEVWW